MWSLSYQFKNNRCGLHSYSNTHTCRAWENNGSWKKLSAFLFTLSRCFSLTLFSSSFSSKSLCKFEQQACLLAFFPRWPDSSNILGRLTTTTTNQSLFVSGCFFFFFWDMAEKWRMGSKCLICGSEAVIGRNNCFCKNGKHIVSPHQKANLIAIILYY